MKTIYKKYLKLDIDGAHISLPEWKVTFNGNFWGHSSREKAGQEILVNKPFVWDDEAWTIPAIYICSKGLVVDFCLQVPQERIRSFMNKWNLTVDSDATEFTNEQHMQIDVENPLNVNMNPKVTLNGAELTASHGCGLCWNPCSPEESNGLDAQSALQHYKLDPEQGYAIWRSAFPWKTKRKPQLRTLSVRLEQEPVTIPGSHFKVAAAGDQAELMHPSTGKKYTLTVQEYERQELSVEDFHDPNLEFPTHFVTMSYTLSPDLPDQSFMITDCARGDRPRQKRTDPLAPQANGDIFCMGISAGVSGPTVVAFGGSNQAKLRVACSALHFEPVEHVEWRIEFREKTRSDIDVDLI